MTINTYILLISCPDKAGIIHHISEWIFNQSGNILELEQFVDHEHQHFFLRIKWQQEESSLQKLIKAFQAIANTRHAKYQIFSEAQKDRLALLCSKTEHCLGEILMAHQQGLLNVEIPLVISNHQDCERIARQFNIPFIYTPSNSSGYEKKQLEALKKHKVDIIGLARYMKILSGEFIAEFPQKIINIHHSFLPAFIGNRPYHEAYERGVKLIGATSHFVIPELDQGPIIHQNIKSVSHTHNVRDLISLGKSVEKNVFLYALKKWTERKLLVHKNRVIVFD